jgi:SAM-dependent methyltransferase
VGVQTHIRGNTEVPGPSPDDLLSLISERKGLEALISLIAFPWCSTFFKKIRLLRRITQRDPFRWSTLSYRKTALKKWIKDSNSVTAEDWFALFFQRSLIHGDLFNYFFYRLVQPRHLAALSLISTFPKNEKPILDLACGFGHLSHYLTECNKAHQVVAMDRNFIQLWVSKYWIAPKAQYVCSDANFSLPLKDDTLGGVLCSDAFHYFENELASLDEMRRCAPGRTIILTRVGNLLVKPNEGNELSPEGYQSLVNTPDCRMIDEVDLVESYLAGTGPQLLNARSPESLRGKKWLSIILSKDKSVVTNHGKFETLPHSVGYLGVNPIYKKSNFRFNGSLELSFEFPSSWFGFENALMQGYHPQKVTIDKDVYQQIIRNTRTDSVTDLISKFVVLGMPQRYARSQL